MAVITLAPQAARRLPAVNLDVTETLTVEALGQPVSGYMNLDFYNYIAK
jgi:hypothetical protein